MPSNPPTNTPTGPDSPQGPEIVVSGRTLPPPPPVDPQEFSIERFKAKLSGAGGTLRSTLYRVVFTGSRLNDEVYKFLAERVELPDVSLDTEKIRRFGYGPLEDVPYRPVFQPLRVTIIAPESRVIGIADLVNTLSGTTPFNTTNKKSYNMASNNLNISVAGGKFAKTASPYEVAYKDDIVFTTKVIVYTAKAKELITYNFNQCFLRSMSPIDLSWSATDQYVKVDMTIGYTDFYLT